METTPNKEGQDIEEVVDSKESPKEEQVEELDKAETKEEQEEHKETIEKETVAKEEQKEETSEDKKLEEAEAKAKEYLDRWQRLMAEFDNFRKRSEKEKSDSYDYAVSNTVADLLPIIDNFERALNIESTDKKLYTGVKMIYKQIMDLLEKLHVSPIEAVGTTFDPNLHNAILHIDDDQFGENTIAEEIQKGYLYKEKVIRHSVVKVAN